MASKKRKIHDVEPKLSAYAAISTKPRQLADSESSINGLQPSESIVADEEEIHDNRLGARTFDAHEAKGISEHVDQVATNDASNESAADFRELRMDRLASAIKKVKAHRISMINDTCTLDQGQEIFITGEYCLEVIQGVVRIYGAILTPRSCSGSIRICAPATHAIPGVLSMVDESILRLTPAESDPKQMQSINLLSRLSPHFSNIWSGIRAAGSRNASKSFSIIWNDEVNGLDSSYDFQFRPLETTHWQTAMSSLCQLPASRVLALVCGSAARGKSTFARYAVNMFVTRVQTAISEPIPFVLLLDFDFLNQELSPPGQISLHAIAEPVLSPPYFHAGHQRISYQSIRAHQVGLTGYHRDDQHYLSACRDLLMRARKIQTERSLEGYSVPIIAKCPAWMSGEVDSLRDLTRAAEPSHVICLCAWRQVSTKDGRSYETQIVNERPIMILEGALEKSRTQLLCVRAHTWVSDPTPFTRRPSQLQEMQLISYFHQLHRNDLGWDCRPLITQRARLLSYGTARRDFACVYIPHAVSRAQECAILQLLTGKMVSVTILDDYEHDFDEKTVMRGKGDEIPYIVPGLEPDFCDPIQPGKSHTIGLAFIKAIDTHEKLIQVYTGIPESVLTEYDLGKAILVLDTSLPTSWAYEEHLHHNKTCGEEDRVAVESATPYTAGTALDGSFDDN